MIFGANPLLLKKKGGGIPTDYLFFYTMDNISGSTLVDEGGTYNGTIVDSPSVITGVNGNALSFDGTNDAVTVNLNAEPTLSALSFSLWFNCANDSTNRLFMAHGGSADPSDQRFIIQIFTDNNFYFDIDNSLTGRISAAWNTATANQWNNLIGTYDGTTQALYFNGTQIASQTQSGLLLDFNVNFRLSSSIRRDNSTISYHATKLDQIRFYGRGLTAEEISALANEF